MGNLPGTGLAAMHPGPSYHNKTSLVPGPNTLALSTLHHIQGPGYMPGPWLVYMDTDSHYYITYCMSGRYAYGTRALDPGNSLNARGLGGRGYPHSTDPDLWPGLTKPSTQEKKFSEMWALLVPEKIVENLYYC